MLGRFTESLAADRSVVYKSDRSHRTNAIGETSSPRFFFRCMNTPDSPISPRQFNTRLGLFLFVIYLVLYVGFVLINAFFARSMEVIVLAGLNLAIVYGFGLIAAALLLAFVYGVLAKVDVDESDSNEPSSEGDGE